MGRPPFRIRQAPPFNGTVNMSRLATWRRAYYAAISYTDYNIGVLLGR